MKLATVRHGGTLTAALVEGDRVRPLPYSDVGAALAAGVHRTAAAGVASDLATVALDHATLAPVVTRPGQFLCLGHNFRSHVEEMGRSLPTHPTLFAKSWRTLIGARDPISLPSVSDQVDWESELALVIGATTRRAGVDEAAAAIAGYTVCNDVSVRDWQGRTLQWFQGKSFEATAPLGPWLVTADEVDPAEMRITCEVDGERVQEAIGSDLIFSPIDVVRYVSTFTTLDPGDVISLGTTGGVGAARTPPVFLREGQVVRTAIEGIGELLNRCEADPR